MASITNGSTSLEEHLQIKTQTWKQHIQLLVYGFNFQALNLFADSNKVLEIESGINDIIVWNEDREYKDPDPWYVQVEIKRLQ